MPLLPPVLSDIAVSLLAIQRLGHVAAAHEEHLGVAVADPHRERGRRDAQRAYLDPINAWELDPDPDGEVGADR